MTRELRPCPACDRHVSLAAATCAFCAAPLVSIAPREPLVHVSRTSRAAIFAGALTIAPLGCGSQVQYQPLPASSTSNASAGEVRGRVLRDSGQAAAGVYVTLHGDNLRPIAQGSTSLSVPADSTGYFAFVNIPVGQYRVAIPGLRDSPTVAVRARQAAFMSIELDPPPKHDHRHMAKPYGAPPARRRVV